MSVDDAVGVEAVAPPDEDEELAGPPPPHRASRSRVFLPRSLTSRLVLGVVSLVVLLVAAIGTSTYFSLKSFLFNRLDQQLAPIASANGSHITDCVRFGIATCSLSGGPYRAPQTEWVAVIDSHGASVIPVEAGEDLKPLNLTLAQGRELVSDPTSVRTVRTSHGAELRVTARAVSTPSGDLVVVSGLQTNEVHNTLGRLVLVELIIGCAAVLLAFLATSYGVRFSLRRLREVTGTARTVAAELSPEGKGLDRRVPVAEQDTEVGQLAESVNTLLGAVETQFAARLESEQRMRQFLADASHELRTPLTSIRGYAELARMQRELGNPAEDNLDRIESEGTRMSRLVDDLLLLARGDADASTHAADRAPIDVADLLEDVANGSRAAHPDRQIDVEAVPLTSVPGDRDQLLRVVRNLVTNAAVHTRPGRPILVRGYPDGPGVTIQVADGGPGLPPDEAAHVFERFWRADKARTRARGGTGLGLAIVAAVVRAHGGSVRFDSSVESGSTVTVWLPGTAD